MRPPTTSDFGFGMAERHGGAMKIVAECEIHESEVEVGERRGAPMALAHSGRIQVERTDGEALRVIVRACSVLWVSRLRDHVL